MSPVNFFLPVIIAAPFSADTHDIKQILLVYLDFSFKISLVPSVEQSSAIIISKFLID